MLSCCCSKILTKPFFLSFALAGLLFARQRWSVISRMAQERARKCEMVHTYDKKDAQIPEAGCQRNHNLETGRRIDRLPSRLDLAQI
jgi:hypothetical protein